MARPAASSAARLMRKPEDSFSSDLLIAPSLTDRLRYAFSAAMLLLRRRPTVFLLEGASGWFPLHPCCGWGCVVFRWWYQPGEPAAN